MNGMTTMGDEPTPRRFAPTCLADLEPVAAAYKANEPVLVTMPDNQDLRRRIMDFLAGLTCGRGGELERIKSGVVLLHPPP